MGQIAKILTLTDLEGMQFLSKKTLVSGDQLKLHRPIDKMIWKTNIYEEPTTRDEAVR